MTRRDAAKCAKDKVRIIMDHRIRKQHDGYGRRRIQQQRVIEIDRHRGTITAYYPLPRRGS
jgi:hypothetical protein